MGEYKTPGVYIKEKNAFGNSIVEAETAIPVFIGLTEKALNGTESLLNKPVRISSMTEYNTYFGGAPMPKFTLSIEAVKGDDTTTCLCCFPDKKNKTALKVKALGTIYTLYHHMMLFFANGGGACYVVSMGDYTQTLSELYAESKETVFANIKKERDITMLVVPEAVNEDNYMNIYTDLLGLCDSKKYFVIVDVPQQKTDVSMQKTIENFRNGIGSNNLKFAAAYYPWLETSVLSDNDITQDNIVWSGETPTLLPFFNWTPSKEGDVFPLDKYITNLHDPKNAPVDKKALHNALLQNWPEYKLVVKKVKDYLNH